MRPTFVSTLLILGLIPTVMAHDIPDARVDRSIQVTLAPGLLQVEYEISLAELTLIQDLRRFDVDLPAGDRESWFRLYGQRIGALDAKGFLVEVDGEPIEVRPIGFDLAIEAHPRFTFHFDAKLPTSGRLSLNDTNYLSSEGTSRLALRPLEGLEVRGNSLAVDVRQIEIRPVWQLTDDEEKRTRRLKVEYSKTLSISGPLTSPPVFIPRRPEPGLSSLLDRAGGRAWPALLIAAFVLGAVHAIQPGHGKVLVAGYSLEPGNRIWRGPLLGLATATAHLASVALIALVLWLTRDVGPGEIHRSLARMAGFVISAIGFWRLGRHLGAQGEDNSVVSSNSRGPVGLISLALAGGIVPCWDAVALVLLSGAIGRFKLGLALLLAFSLGMAGILVMVGMLAGVFRVSVRRFDPQRRWERRSGLVGGLILAAIGIIMMGDGSIGRWINR